MSTKVKIIAGIEERIFYIRGKKVMLDRDLAELYGVLTKVLNQAVKRNQKRFPEDFMFQLTIREKEQLVTICDRFSTLKHATVTPFAFSEQGIAMLSTVLNSERAIQVNIAIMRAFVKMREILATHKELADRLTKLESRMDKKDQETLALFEAIRRLMAPPPEAPRRKIGF